MKIKKITKKDIGTVRNLTVHRNHTFLTENGICTHNCDGFSDSAFKALRAVTEEFSANTRFIATCNYINKIPDAIQSRFEVINYDFTKEEENELLKGYVVKLYNICKEEGLDIEKTALVELVKRKFPDLRSILNSLQGYFSEGKKSITLDDIKKFNSVHKDVFELIFNNVDPVKNYQYLVSEYSLKVDEVLSSLGNEFVEYLKMEKPESIKFLPQIIIEVAKYQSMRFQVVDQMISLLACVYSLQTIVRS